MLNMLRSSFFSSFLEAPSEKSPLHMPEPSQPCLYNFMSLAVPPMRSFLNLSIRVSPRENLIIFSSVSCLFSVLLSVNQTSKQVSLPSCKTICNSDNNLLSATFIREAGPTPTAKLTLHISLLSMVSAIKIKVCLD